MLQEKRARSQKSHAFGSWHLSVEDHGNILKNLGMVSSLCLGFTIAAVLKPSREDLDIMDIQYLSRVSPLFRKRVKELAVEERNLLEEPLETHSDSAGGYLAWMKVNLRRKDELLHHLIQHMEESETKCRKKHEQQPIWELNRLPTGEKFCFVELDDRWFTSMETFWNEVPRWKIEHQSRMAYSELKLHSCSRKMLYSYTVAIISLVVVVLLSIMGQFWIATTPLEDHIDYHALDAVMIGFNRNYVVVVVFMYMLFFVGLINFAQALNFYFTYLRMSGSTPSPTEPLVPRLILAGGICLSLVGNCLFWQAAYRANKVLRNELKTPYDAEAAKPLLSKDDKEPSKSASSKRMAKDTRRGSADTSDTD